MKAVGSYQSIPDLKAGRNIRIGGDQITGNYTLFSLLSVDCLGLDAKVVSGYAGSKMALALAQEELAGGALTLATALRSINTGQVKPLFVISSKRDPALPDTPALTELIELPKEKVEVVKLLENIVASKVLFTSAGVPGDRVIYLREIHERIMSQPDVRQDLEKQFGYNVAYPTADELEKKASTIKARKNEIKKIYSDLFEKYFAK